MNWNSEEAQRILVGIFAGIVFVGGIGIGVKLYSKTSDSAQSQSKTGLLLNRE